MEVSVIDAVELLLSGAKIALILSFLSIFLGFVIGIVVAIAESYGGRTVRYIAMAYENILRGIPLLAIYFILFFSLPMIIHIGMSAFLTAVIGLGIRSSAYQSQIFRSGIQAVDKGQIEAAMSLGMTKTQTILHIVLPQALRFSIPAWLNEYAVVLKDTSIALVLGIVEITERANELAQITREPFTYYGMAALIYLVIVLTVVSIANRIGKKYKIKGVGGMIRV